MSLKNTNEAVADSIRVCLLWHGVDSGNLGVRALTESQIHLIRHAAQTIGRQVNFEIVGWARSENPGDFKALGVNHVTPVSGRNLFRAAGVRAAFRRADIVFDIGEGDSFSDIYGFKRLLYFSATKWMAAGSGAPLVLSPQTIGPFSRWWSVMMSDSCMRKAAHLFPRDELSLKYIAGRNLGVPFDEIVDVAFGLPYQRRQEVADTGHIAVGINVSGLLWSEAGGSNRFKLTLDYRSFTRHLIDYFLQQEGVQVVLVPHVLSDEESIDDDLSICAAIQRDFPSTSIAPRFSGPSAAKSFISGLDFFVGARMHACIAAISSGVPVVPLAYSRKFTGLFNTVGYPHVADCQSMAEADALSMVRRTYDERRLLSPKILAANEVAAGRLKIYTDKVAALLNAVGRR